MALKLILTSKSWLSSDIPEGTTGQLSIGCLQAMAPLTRLEMLEMGLLWVSRMTQSYHSSWAQIGP